MKTTTWSIITLALGLGIGGMLNRSGIMDGVGTFSRREDPPPAKSIASGEKALVDDFLKGQFPENLTAEEAYQLLYPWLSRGRDALPATEEELKLANQCELLLDRLPLTVLQELLDLARKGKLPLKQTHDTFAVYALRDWEKAMAWADRQPDSRDLLSTAISRMAESEPDRALALYQQATLDGDVPEEEAIVAKLSKHHAKSGQAGFFAFLDALPAMSRDIPYRLALTHLPDGDIPAFLEGFKQRENRGTSVPRSRLVLQLAGRAPEECRRWIKEMPLGERVQAEFELALDLSSRGRVDEAGSIINDLFSEEHGSFVRENLLTLVDHPELAEKVIAMLPEGGKLTAEDFDHVLPSLFDEEPARMLDKVKLLPTPEEQAEYLVRAFGKMSTNDGLRPKDFEILSNRLRTSGPGGKDGERVKAALDEARARVLKR